METRLEKAIGRNVRDFVWKILGGVSVILAIAAAVIKLG